MCLKLSTTFLIMILSNSLMATGWDFDINKWLRTIDNILRVGKLEQGGNNGGIVKTFSKQNCLDKFVESQKNSGSSGVQSAIYLSGAGMSKSEIVNPQSIPGHDISNDRYFKFFPGIAYQRGRRWNSYNPALAPHLSNVCSKYWQVQNIELVKWSGKLCRRVRLGMKAKYYYHLLYCQDDLNIYTDFSNTKMELVKYIRCR